MLEGGRLDLLGVDPQGVWTVVEIKRGRLYRDTVAQALDYASSVSTMPAAKLRDIVDGFVGGDVARRSPVAEALEEGEGASAAVYGSWSWGQAAIRAWTGSCSTSETTTTCQFRW